MITVPEVGTATFVEQLEKNKNADRYELLIFLTRKMPFEQYENWMIDYDAYLSITGIHPIIEDVTNDYYDHDCAAVD